MSLSTDQGERTEHKCPRCFGTMIRVHNTHQLSSSLKCTNGTCGLYFFCRGGADIIGFYNLIQEGQKSCQCHSILRAVENLKQQLKDFKPE